MREKPLIDPLFLHVFEWFTDLNKTRFNYVGMDFALAPLQPQNILAYMQLRQVIPHPDEFSLLCDMDSIYLELLNKPANKSH